VSFAGLGTKPSPIILINCRKMATQIHLRAHDSEASRDQLADGAKMRQRHKWRFVARYRFE
jgi:hypothetical protein